MKIGIIVGSIRKESYNLKLAEYLIDRFKDIRFSLIDIKNMPMFSEDIEDQKIDIVDKNRKLIKESDALIIISPEYNGSIPGVLKNSLDWFSRKEYPFMNKPYMLMGATIGNLGTIKVQAELRELFDTAAYKMVGIPNNEFGISKIQEKIEDDKIVDERTIEKIDERMKEFINWIDKVK